MTCLLLPWPCTELWPNRRHHWRKRAAAAKAYRRDCGWLAIEADMTLPEEGVIPLAITFRAPTRRSYDLDNALAAIKAGIDGCCDAWHVNDKRFTYTLSRGDPVPGGAVEVREALLPAGGA